jgi:hypothetical protein
MARKRPNSRCSGKVAQATRRDIANKLNPTTFTTYRARLSGMSNSVLSVDWKSVLMVSRTLPTSLILSLAFVSTACGGDDQTADAASTTFSTSAGTDTGTETNEGNDMSMTGDGDGDGDQGDGDGDGDQGDGDGDQGDGDGDQGDGDGDGDPMECIDLDQDGYGENCPQGTDCDDADYNNHTVDGCANCADADMDGQWVLCDTFDENKPGPDCDDADFNVFSDEGCANCVDNDNDDVWVGCDQYGDDKPGPDCADDNPNVGLDDAVEICNGISENCAGEIDNAPANEMCPPEGIDPPNVDPVNGWLCMPPGPGQDGCVINGCVEQFFDLDNQVPNGCECEGTSRTVSLSDCSDFPQGFLGDLGEADALGNLPIGTIPEIDNDVGNGAEDWYWLNHDEFDAMGIRPNNGSIQVSFAVNDALDYRFEVYRACNQIEFANGLATQFGAGAPPTREWWFFDNHATGAMYTNNVTWPNRSYIRVFRVANDGTCNNYQLAIQRGTN